MKYFIGGDVSKGYTDWVILNEKKKIVHENFQLDDTYDGHCKLFSVLDSIFKKYPSLEMYAAVESTGGYENNWYNTLKRFQSEFNLKVARVNPTGVNFDRKASLKRNVTDAISALHIAEYMINHPEKVEYDKDEYWTNLRRHWNFVEMQKKQRVQTINQLETLLYSAHPTLMQYKDDNFPNWLLELIIQCPTAEKLSKAKPEKLSEISYLSKEKAYMLIEDAKKNIASATDKNAEELVRQTALQIKTFDQSIKRQMALIEAEMIHQDIDILKTFKGIDTVSAIGLMLEIGTIERFARVKSICCFFGVHPKFKQSGDKIIGVKMSKQGSANMRKILFNIAKGAINYNPLIREIYEKKCSEGMSKLAAIGVCMHKILRIIYGMLKHKQAFNPEIDKLNRERSNERVLEEKQQEFVNVEKNRRYQQFDTKAPVSRKQTKKRKEYELSQCELNAHNAGSKYPSLISS